MANAKTKRGDTDGVFFLKLTMYVVLGSLWLKVQGDAGWQQIPVPVGLIVGLIFASHEHFQIDRKVEYAVLVVAALIGFIAPYGLFINL
jgi:hypothetical protein